MINNRFNVVYHLLYECKKLNNIKMENILNVCRIIYSEYQIDIYDEVWSQGDEFIIFKLNNEYIGRIHKYQLCDIIKQDLYLGGDKHLKYALGI
jgi:hypothetical protein